MFLLIQQGKVSVRHDELNLKNMQNLVGEEGDSASIEFVYHCFSDANIDLVCDDSFLYKFFPVTCVDQNYSIRLCGNVLAVAHRNGEIIGLTQTQVDIVLNELFVSKAKVGNKIIMVPAKTLYQPEEAS
ncbi:DUF3846 domain-containing protein [Laspinema olomoucense]|uniref:DUF3846 domain-containing protein n=1 Tax=Laspinema olomoucense TaxID=3231600 RepID=UPI0021BB3F6D|nr:hypothetical protein [Laspinema sp. D3d]MCT7971261.1 hypothetical protein [Laspinema sp. D3d]